MQDGERGKNKSSNHSHFDGWSWLHGPCDLEDAVTVMNDRANRNAVQ
jgi:hypothetical protein